jgi:hypothetical protein
MARSSALVAEPLRALMAEVEREANADSATLLHDRQVAAVLRATG